MKISYCPNCTEKLQKDKKTTAQGISYCKNCGSYWCILFCKFELFKSGINVFNSRSFGYLLINDLYDNSSDEIKEILRETCTKLDHSLPLSITCTLSKKQAKILNRYILKLQKN